MCTIQFTGNVILTIVSLLFIVSDLSAHNNS